MKLYKNLKIRAKYFIPVFIISIGFLFVVVYGIKALNSTSESMVNFIDGDQSLLLALSNMYACLLYTSDAADERSSVDLGGRRIIKKKKKTIKRK